MTTISSKQKTADERSINLLASAFLTLAEEMIEQEHSDDVPQDEAEDLEAVSTAGSSCKHKGGMK